VSAAPTFGFTVDARAENVAVVRHALRRFLEPLSIEELLIGDILLAVSEACTNSVVHAYRDATGPVHVQASVTAERVEVLVRDEGSGIAPRVESGGLGIGLPVIMALAHSVAIRAASGGGTELRMRFPLAAAQRA
jgi:serine/threonine-protein kinase RsbW